VDRRDKYGRLAAGPYLGIQIVQPAPFFRERLWDPAGSSRPSYMGNIFRT
jgi:hypothetical protein